MATLWTRRSFVRAGSVAALATGALAADSPAKAKVLAFSCSHRKGKTTAAALQAALDSAKEVGVDVELIELAAFKMNPVVPGAAPDSLPADDFAQIEAKILDPKVAGILIGTPVYFGSMSSMAKCFLERWIAFRKNFALRNKVGGALAVGGNRNGGQELTLQGIHAAMLAQDMLVVGDGKPTSHLGATLWNQGDDVTKDPLGLVTAKNLGRRVAEVALKMI